VEIHTHVLPMYSIATQLTTQGSRVNQTHTVSLSIPETFSKNIVSSHGQTGLDTHACANQFATRWINLLIHI